MVVEKLSTKLGKNKGKEAVETQCHQCSIKSLCQIRTLIEEEEEIKSTPEMTNAGVGIRSLQIDEVGENFGEVERITAREHLELAENVHSLLECNVLKLIEKDIVKMGTNDLELQVFTQSNDSSIKTLSGNRTLLHDSNVSENEGFDENNYYKSGKDYIGTCPIFLQIRHHYRDKKSYCLL